MRKYIIIISIAAVVFFIQSCYTIIKKVNVEHIHSETSLQFPDNSVLNPQLEGVWINNRLWGDYGYQIRRLEIRNNGDVIYIPNSERSNSKIYYGRYGILSDTLIIKFNWENNAEWMNYKLNDNTLVISYLRGRKGKEYNLINDCTNCTLAWSKIQ